MRVSTLVQALWLAVLLRCRGSVRSQRCLRSKSFVDADAEEDPFWLKYRSESA